MQGDNKLFIRRPATTRGRSILLGVNKFLVTHPTGSPYKGQMIRAIRRTTASTMKVLITAFKNRQPTIFTNNVGSLVLNFATIRTNTIKGFESLNQRHKRRGGGQQRLVRLLSFPYCSLSIHLRPGDRAKSLANIPFGLDLF